MLYFTVTVQLLHGQSAGHGSTATHIKGQKGMMTRQHTERQHAQVWGLTKGVFFFDSWWGIAGPSTPTCAENSNPCTHHSKTQPPALNLCVGLEVANTSNSDE